MCFGWQLQRSLDSVKRSIVITAWIRFCAVQLVRLERSWALTDLHHLPHAHVSRSIEMSWCNGTKGRRAIHCMESKIDETVSCVIAKTARYWTNSRLRRD